MSEQNEQGAAPQPVEVKIFIDPQTGAIVGWDGPKNPRLTFRIFSEASALAMAELVKRIIEEEKKSQEPPLIVRPGFVGPGRGL